jgi:L-fuconolactonase
VLFSDTQVHPRIRVVISERAGAICCPQRSGTHPCFGAKSNLEIGGPTLSVGQAFQKSTATTLQKVAKSALPFPIVDAHAHLFNPQLFNYPWLDGLEALKKPHLLNDYVDSVGTVEVETMVFVEAAAADGSSLDEAAWVAGFAQGHARIGGLVAGAPLELGHAVRPHLEALLQHKLLRGIRRIAAPPFQPDPDFCLRPSFIEGVRLLPEYGLTFDLGVQRQDLPKALDLVRKCPNVRFVLNHMANPAISDGLMEPWASDIRALAGMQNVWCKLSGLIPLAGLQWTTETLGPYVLVALEAFGPRRAMFGSDWPLTNLNGGSYKSWVGSLWQILAGGSEIESRDVFRETAIRFYNL